MQNIEYKAELRDPALARTICASIGALFADTLVQTDTYYRIPDAKLKKRETVGRDAEYIFYNRPARSRPKLSQFTLYTKSQAAERFGSSPLPVWVTVKKSRDLWIYQGVRIHIDTVDALGSFIEFEALVTPDRNLARSHELIEHLRTTFAPAMGEAISCGYAELIAGDTDTAAQ